MKLLVKAVNREYPDNIGDYLWKSFKGAASDLNIELVRVPTEMWDYNDIKHASQQEVNWVNAQSADGFIFFTNWINGARYRNVAFTYKNMTCPTIFWSREDPNHFDIFLTDARYADIVATCASECVPKYEFAYPGKKVINLPMAAAPEIFYPGTDSIDREWDIVFLGNRYPTRRVRNSGEDSVVIAAAEWALENKKRMGVWGLEDTGHGWKGVSKIYNTGIFQGGRVDRLQAAEIYRSSRVALSVASNSESPTMAPNRVVQILATGIPLITYMSKATEWQSGGFANISCSAFQTQFLLDEIFNGKPLVYAERANRARKHVMGHHTFKIRLESILEALNE